MIYRKTNEEIEVLRQGGKILADILNTLCESVRPGVSSADLEFLALSLIEKAGGRSSFKGYNMGGGIFFPSALCVSVNEEVVHGSSLPNKVLKEGDIVNLDIGMEWPVQSEEEAQKNNRPYNHHSEKGGFYTDTCRTVGVGKISREAQKLIDVSREALALGISKAIPGNSLNDIGEAIGSYVEKNNFTAVRDLVGHGVGYFAHEDPNVFNYKIGKNSSDNLILKEGMVIAIEPMINQGRYNVKIAKNNYTFLTADSSLSAHFEHSIAITKDSNIILTAL